MKKQQKQLLILLLVLVALAACFLGVKQYNKVQSKKPAEETQEQIVIAVDDDEMLRFTYDYEGVSYTFEKEEGIWYYADDHSLKINQNQIIAMINKVAPLKVQQVISDVTDMSQYGLLEPARTITYETATDTFTLLAGNYNSMARIYYICLPTENTVYTVNGPVINGFNYTLEDLVEVEETETVE